MTMKNIATAMPDASRLADRVGATASFLCALHCAALPVAIALLPTLGLGFLADHAFERIFVSCSITLATISLAIGFRQHRRLAALLLMLPGVALLVGGLLMPDDHGSPVHAVLVTAGGILVMCAHLANLRLTHSGNADRRSGCASSRRE